MQEWLLIVLAVGGIFLLGLFFSILGFFQSLARWLFLGLFVLVLLLLVNRIFPAIDSATRPDGRSYPSDESFRLPRIDRDSEFAEYLENLGEDIDEFVFGSSQSYPRTTPRSRDLVYPLPGSEPEPEAIAGQPPEQPPAQPIAPNQPQISFPSDSSSQLDRPITRPITRQPTGQPTDQTSQQRPVSAMW